MGKKRKKRKRLKFKSVFITLLILILLGLISYASILIRPRTYFVYNTVYLTDEEVLKELKLNADSSFVLTNNIMMKNIVKKSKLIKDVKVHRTFDLEIKLDIKENRMLFIDSNDNKVVLEDGQRINYNNSNIPTLINKIEDKDVYANFVKKMSKISVKDINSISEIKYSPNGIDKERFLLSMNDGNYVYVTLTKLFKINDYKTIIDSVEGKKGVLYLDYGNYFVPKE